MFKIRKLLPDRFRYVQYVMYVVDKERWSASYKLVTVIGKVNYIFIIYCVLLTEI